MKEKLQAFKEGFQLKLREARVRFAELWSAPEKAYLFRGVFVLGLTAFFVLMGSSFLLGQQLWRQSPSYQRKIAQAKEDQLMNDLSQQASKMSNDDEASSSHPVIGVRPIPRSILRRQDGVQEPDKDLVLTESKTNNRSLASKGLNTSPAPYNPFFSYNDIVGSSSNNSSHVAKMALDVAFEVDTALVMQELTEREKEMKFLISSLMAEISYEEYRSPEGSIRLKKRIYKEMNLILKSGQIKDVLFNNFVVK